ncbi:hypothetical protein AB0B63_07120 [Micromonospora sp. NPDC049081]|uniref:hypothetical protein n=1 Tax=Micromonospora sp. NPDC049081 TaxID=3155150 RepID=UPI0033F2AABE
MTDSSELLDIVCDVDVPRDGENTAVPQIWLKDLFPEYPTVGLVVFLLSHDLGEVVPGLVLAERGHPNDPPVAEMVRELKRGGYLVPESVDGVKRLRLVHPARLGPLPTA